MPRKKGGRKQMKKGLNHMDQKTYERYLRGELSNAEMHEVERALESSKFEREAMEGLELLSADQMVEDLAMLGKKIDSQLSKSGSINWYQWAAILPLLLVAGFAVWWLIKTDENTSLKKPLALKADSATVEDRPQPITPPPLVTKEERGKIEEESDTKPPILNKKMTKAVTVSSTNKPEVEKGTIEEIDDRSSDVLKREVAALKGTKVSESEDAFAEAAQSSEELNLNTNAITISEEPEVSSNVLITENAATKDDFDFPAETKKETFADSESRARIKKSNPRKKVSAELDATKGFYQPIEPDKKAVPSVSQDDYEIYLRNNLKYPARARKAKMEGEVEISFTVEISGKLSNFVVTKSLGSGCDKEAIRLLREGPRWEPARREDTPIPSVVSKKISFFLNKK